MSLATLREPIAERVPWARVFCGMEPFPRSIAPSDIDGFVHLKEANRVLVLEAKRHDERMTVPQRMALEGLAWNDIDVVVVRFSGNWHVETIEHLLKDAAPRSATNDDLVRLLENWARWAVAHPKPERLSLFDL